MPARPGLLFPNRRVPPVSVTSSDPNKTRHPTAPASGDPDVEDTLPEGFDLSRFAPRGATVPPHSVSQSEDEEMAELMRALRESIPYQEEDEPPKETQRPASPSSSPSMAFEAPTSRTSVAPGPGSGHSPEPEPEAGPDSDSAEDDFARLLRTLRESIPDDPEPVAAEPSQTEAAAEPEWPLDRSAAVPDRPLTETPEPRTVRAAPYFAAPEPEPEPEVFEPEPAAYTPPAVGRSSSAPSATDHPVSDSLSNDHHGAGHEDSDVEIPPGDAGLFADLLSSLRESAPRSSETDPSLDLDPVKEITANRDRLRDLRADNLRADEMVDELDEEDEGESEPEPSRLSRVWKIALMLGGASAMGLAVALINPFGESSPPSPPPTPVVVPTTNEDVGKFNALVPTAQHAPVTVPILPAPEPPPAVVKPIEPAPAPSPAPVSAPALTKEASPPVAPPPVEAAAAPPVAAPPLQPAPPPAAAPPPVASRPPIAEPPPVAALPPAPEPPPPAAPPPSMASARSAPPPAPPPVQVAAVAPPPVAVASAPVPSKRPVLPPEPAKSAALSSPPAPPPVEAPPSAERSPPSAERPPVAPSGPRVFTVQVGSFQVLQNADFLINDLKKKGFDAYSKDWTDGGGRLWHVVRVGRLSNRAAANALVKHLSNGTDLEPYILSVH